MAAAKPGKPAPRPESPVEHIEDARTVGETAGEVVESVSTASGPVAGAVVDSGRAQALSMAMLDAAGHLRRVETLSLAALATGLEAILAGEADRGAAAIEAAEASLDKAIGRLARVVALSDPSSES